MLNIDSLVFDLIHAPKAEPDPEGIALAFASLDPARAKELADEQPEAPSGPKLVDVDMQDPRFDMQIAPTLPMRARGERRIMVIDDSVSPMRDDPQTQPVIPLDLNPAREALIAYCATAPIRLGRIFALGSWGDAVLVARSARDLRALCLLPWVMDPSVDIDGRRRATRLTQPEFEAKLAAYEKRLDELDEAQILASLGPARFERRGELLVVDVLEADGSWDQRKSLAVEDAIAAIDKFSTFPGAPSGPRKPAPAPAPTKAVEAAPPVVTGPPLSAKNLGDQIIVVFPQERFDLDVAAALGKGDWDSVLRSSDELTRPQRDALHGGKGGFVAPLEFLSEVFMSGKPLSRPQFDQEAVAIASGVRALEVHCPRFGPVTLFDIEGRGRFITSVLEAPEAVLALVHG